MLKKTEILEILKTLEFDSEAMGRLLTLIDKVEGDTLDLATIRAVKIIMLEEEEKALDQVAGELEVDVANDPSLKQVESEYKKEVEDIRSEFKSDMQEMDDELDKLDQANNELNKVEESIQIDQLTQSLKV